MLLKQSGCSLLFSGLPLSSLPFKFNQGSSETATDSVQLLAEAISLAFASLLIEPSLAAAPRTT